VGLFYLIAVGGSLRAWMKVIARTPRALESAEFLAEATDDQTKPARKLARCADHSEIVGRGCQLAGPISERVPRLRNLRSIHVCPPRTSHASSARHSSNVFGAIGSLIYYLSKSASIFRDRLVKALASEFQTRIEIRQSGVRRVSQLRGPTMAIAASPSC